MTSGDSSVYLYLGPSVRRFKTRQDQLTYALKLRPEGLCLEFGVFKGKTARHIQSQLGPQESLYAFDSFEGLPEKWDLGRNVHPAGHFNLKGKIPKLLPGTIPVKGRIEQTLPAWIDGKSPGLKIGFVHIDVDIYSATKTILSLIKPHLAARAIIVFDELADFQNPQIYTNWREGEYKALMEELPNHEIISATETYAVAIRI